jgi:hypothetical protein
MAQSKKILKMIAAYYLRIVFVFPETKKAIGRFSRRE